MPDNTQKRMPPTPPARGAVASNEQQPPAKIYNYYAEMAGILNVGKWIFLVCALFCALFSVFFEKEYYSWENLQYLWRDLTVSGVNSGSYFAITYDEQQNMAFTEFRSELVVAGSGGLKMYDGNGTCLLTENISYSSPVLCSGEKFLLMYNANGKEYALFSTLTCKKQSTVDGQIQCGAVANNGWYAIVSQSTDAKYSVSLFNANCVNTVNYRRESYPTDVAFSPDSKTLAVAEVTSEGLSLESQVCLIDISSNDINKVSLGTLLPLRLQYLSNGNVAVICDEAVLILNRLGDKIGRFEFPSMTLSRFDSSEECIVLVCKENVIGSIEHIWVLDKNGTSVYDAQQIIKTVHVTAGSGDNLAYLVSGNVVTVIRADSNRQMSFEGHMFDVCLIKNTPLLCLNDGIQVIEAN